MTKDELKRVKMRVEESKIENGCFVIPKESIEEWIEHYQKMGSECMENGCPTYLTWFYWGKREVLVDMIKHFDEKEED